MNDSHNYYFRFIIYKNPESIYCRKAAGCDYERNSMIQDTDRQLRFSEVETICDSYMPSDAKNQMDRLYYWLPETVIHMRDPEEGGKIPPTFRYDDRVIYASLYRGYIYATGDPAVTQIMGRLYGSAKGNAEKERKKSELIRKRVSRELVEDRNLISQLIRNIKQKVSVLKEDVLYDLCEDLLDLVFELADKRIEMSPLERDAEAAAMDDEVFDGVIYNAAYQLQDITVDSTARAILWLMLGGLLRNEAGRIFRVFNSAFVPSFRQGDLAASIVDKLGALYFDEDYEDIYTGDDLGNRFPGIEWMCDNCGAYLNAQLGFDDHLQVWQCRSCGALNQISAETIFPNEEERERHHPSDWEKMKEAIERRKKELKT